MNRQPRDTPEFTDEQIARRRDELAKHMLNTPPRPLKPKSKDGTKGSPPEKRGRPTNGAFRLLFDTDSMQRQLENLSPLKLQFFKDRINEGSSDAFDIVVTDSMPAISAGGPEQIIIGLRFKF